MSQKKDRYKELEQMLTVFVLLDLLLFIGFLSFASASVVALKLICAGLVIVVSCFGIWVLYNTREFRQPRSAWIKYSFCCILVCTTVAMMTNFP